VLEKHERLLEKLLNQTQTPWGPIKRIPRGEAVVWGALWVSGFAGQAGICVPRSRSGTKKGVSTPFRICGAAPEQERGSRESLEPVSRLGARSGCPMVPELLDFVVEDIRCKDRANVIKLLVDTVLDCRIRYSTTATNINTPARRRTAKEDQDDFERLQVSIFAFRYGFTTKQAVECQREARRYQWPNQGQGQWPCQGEFKQTSQRDGHISLGTRSKEPRASVVADGRHGAAQS
jgi:hypothetical protein